MEKLSIIIPAYNEEKTIKQILRKVLVVKIKDVEKEVIIVDDGSTDGTKTFLEGIKDKRIKTVLCPDNKGKGSAIRLGLSKASGSIILTQDADLEYDPKDYDLLIKPILNKESKVVYGSRNLKKNEYSYFSYYLGGKFLTWLINMLYHSNITDEATGYKGFDAQLIKSIPLKCTGFEFCPEITAKILKQGHRITEVPIHYSPRKKTEGKKIKWLDGVKAAYIIIKYRFTE